MAHLLQELFLGFTPHLHAEESTGRTLTSIGGKGGGGGVSEDREGQQGGLQQHPRTQDCPSLGHKAYSTRCAQVVSIQPLARLALLSYRNQTRGVCSGRWQEPHSHRAASQGIPLACQGPCTPFPMELVLTLLLLLHRGLGWKSQATLVFKPLSRVLGTLRWAGQSGASFSLSPRSRGAWRALGRG